MSILDTAQSDSYFDVRRRMVETQLRVRGIRDQRVLDAMLRIPRHEFVSEEYKSQAYEDHPIPIGEGQTISQPFIVAVSLQALRLQGTESVLEVGTGSGYQTALLAALARQVYSIEHHAALAESAKAALNKLNVANAKIMLGDGSHGVPEHSPYAAILVSAAAPSMPEALFNQLAESGRMVIPVGPQHSQELQLIRKVAGQAVVEVIEGCRFVPLIGAGGY
ncbi:MAG: protein-L-isoaspartate(D-aspartate) O-methyltransferase [Terriglobales bacterium]